MRDNPFEGFPEAELDKLVKSTVKDVKALVKGKRVGYGWSGGKDSIALRWVMEQAGVHTSALVLTDGLEWPAFVKWCEQNAPEGLTTYTQKVDKDWLLKRPKMLFPQGANASAWFKPVQQSGQNRFFSEAELDVVALGRRTVDGNYVGPKGTNIYTPKNNVTRWSPIGHWPHEAVFGLIKREKLAMPPIYEWPRGYRVGTGPWPQRPGTADTDQGFAESWQIDADVIREAATWLPAAREWMDRTDHA